MQETIRQILLQNQIHSHLNEGILVCNVSKPQGLALTKDLLYALVSRKTALYLSGGSTPKSLYQTLATEEKLDSGVVGMIDERVGLKWHEKSNETMIRDAGLLRYLQMKDVKFFPMINGKGREEEADDYDNTLRQLQTVYQSHIAILGIGTDGHTAGIIPNSPLFEEKENYKLVDSFYDEKGEYKERITLTFTGLSRMDLCIVLVFGEDKDQALEKMFSPGSIEEVPARFLKSALMAPKTILLTDREV